MLFNVARVDAKMLTEILLLPNIVEVGAFREPYLGKIYGNVT